MPCIDVRLLPGEYLSTPNPPSIQRYAYLQIGTWCIVSGGQSVCSHNKPLPNKRSAVMFCFLMLQVLLIVLGIRVQQPPNTMTTALALLKCC